MLLCFDYYVPLISLLNFLKCDIIAQLQIPHSSFVFLVLVPSSGPGSQNILGVKATKESE